MLILNVGIVQALAYGFLPFLRKLNLDRISAGYTISNGPVGLAFFGVAVVALAPQIPVIGFLVD
ncbi:MAG: hypothetical protein IH886_13270 [Nitrospinae bacterium]|nr:hypothetical protein [Nitrospinota bacterium]